MGVSPCQLLHIAYETALVDTDDLSEEVFQPNFALLAVHHLVDAEWLAVDMVDGLGQFVVGVVHVDAYHLGIGMLRSDGKGPRSLLSHRKTFGSIDHGVLVCPMQQICVFVYEFLFRVTNFAGPKMKSRITKFVIWK